MEEMFVFMRASPYAGVLVGKVAHCFSHDPRAAGRLAVPGQRERAIKEGQGSDACKGAACGTSCWRQGMSAAGSISCCSAVRQQAPNDDLVFLLELQNRSLPASHSLLTEPGF
ncbi:UNVERIFIED_CONTAM: hypothetical protein FKN15_055313 [Acipenser sinensis]